MLSSSSNWPPADTGMQRFRMSGSKARSSIQSRSPSSLWRRPCWSCRRSRSSAAVGEEKSVVDSWRAQRFCWPPLGCNTSRFPRWRGLDHPARGPADRRLCLAAGSAYWEYVLRRRARTLAAIALERQRSPRPARRAFAGSGVIAAQGQRLGAELEPEHPLMIAARNALAASRGVIADLSASTAATTEAALRVIGDELRHRYGLQIAVRIETPGVQRAAATSIRRSPGRSFVLLVRRSSTRLYRRGPSRRRGRSKDGERSSHDGQR